MTVRVVMALQELPVNGLAVFLAGPTTAFPGESWRPDAVAELAARWAGDRPLVVLSPESRDGVRAQTYREQVLLERAARATATVVLYWMWRDMARTPARHRTSSSGTTWPALQARRRRRPSRRPTGTATR